MKGHVCIIGAGITGITLAKDISNHTIIEKSRGLGGRLAARRMGQTSIEHGPQSFTHPLQHKYIERPHDWVKQEAQGLNILKSWEAQYFEINHHLITVHSTTGEKIDCEKLVITTPAPQAKALITKSGFDGNFLDDVKYKSEIQLLLIGNYKNTTELIKSHFDLITSLTLPGQSEALLFKMKAPFIGDFIDLEKEVIKEKFLPATENPFTDSHIHKWRYSEVTQTIDSSNQLKLSSNNIFLAGDYFSTTGIEGAIASTTYLKVRFTRV